MKPLNITTLLLVIVGGLNWGLVGLLEFDLVAAIFGAGSALSRIVYILVGALRALATRTAAFGHARRGGALPLSPLSTRCRPPLRPASPGFAILWRSALRKGRLAMLGGPPPAMYCTVSA